MDVLIYLIPISLFLGILGLIGFIWALKNRQFEEDEANATRILHDDDDDDQK